MKSKDINRRVFLRSTGVALSLPFLESFGQQFTRNQKQPKRAVFICTKLGLLNSSLFPDSSGPLSASTDYLSILKDHLQDITLFSGLSHENQSGRLSHSSELSWLTAAEHPGLDGFKNSISVDQVASEKFGYVTRFPSLVMSSEGHQSQSFNRNGVMIPAEHSPSNLFAKLFLNGSKKEIDFQRQQLAQNKSILDGLIEQTKPLLQRVSQIDKTRLEQYLESIRQAEKNISEAEQWLDKPKPNIDLPQPKDVSNKADIVGRVRLMFGLIPLILQSDSTRIINMGIQVDHGVLNLPGVNEEHHSLSHHGNDPDKIAKLKIVESSLLRCFGRLLRDLKSTDEESANLLDNTSLLFGSNLGNANNHDFRNLPIMVAGGGFPHGKFISFDKNKNKPLSNLFLSILNQSGVYTDKFGQSTSTLSWK